MVEGTKDPATLIGPTGRGLPVLVLQARPGAGPSPSAAPRRGQATLGALAAPETLCQVLPVRRASRDHRAR